MSNIISDSNIRDHLASLPGWRVEGNQLTAQYEFRDAKTAFSLLTMVAMESECRDHHPKVTFCYNKVSFKLTTHSSGNRITEKDLGLSKFIHRKAVDFGAIE